MKIIIFGASGGTGNWLTRQALAADHDVTAIVRSPETFAVHHPRLTIVPGNVLDSTAVNDAVMGHEAVFVTLGAPARRAGTLRSQGTANIVNAMQQHGIKRLICQSSLGFGDSVEVLKATGFVFRRIIVPVLLADTFADHERQEQVIKSSRLDWTIVRPGNMTNGPLTGVYHHGFSADRRDIKVKVSRADVAHIMLRQLVDNTYLHQAVGISY